MNKVYLICNAHLDPVWLWEWEEGASEAVSTFRIAADFCEQFDGFVFNHNEAVLYQWVEQYEPPLFARIQQLVAAGRWHIMGGWYLQPDCNMPSGESFVRQILTGRQYFLEKFGQKPTVAINFDPFGHSLGLVQILEQAGYTGYIVTRPGQQDCALPADEFIWQGLADSRIAVHRGFAGYNSQRGEIVDKLERYLSAKAGQENGLLLWGIGNHGGGPSREDLLAIGQFAREHPEITFVHGTPETYFAERFADHSGFPTFDRSLNPWAVGCYTSQIRIKQLHRALENAIYQGEKMISAAMLAGVMPSDSPCHAGLASARKDLLFCQFHDILPGSSIEPVEAMSLRVLSHGLEEMSRSRMLAFTTLLSGQATAAEGEIPIFIYNPHPHPVEGAFSCEFQLADQNWTDSFSLAQIYQDGKLLPCQTEQEASNINLDWRKLAVFQARLQPSAMNRFTCRFERVAARPRPAYAAEDGKIEIDNGRLAVTINTGTGLVDAYRIDGKDLLQPGAFAALVMQDDDDPWGMHVHAFREEVGRFSLMSPEIGTRFSGLEDAVIDSVRVIEHGPVRTVVEAVFQYGSSMICQRYKVPAQGTEMEIEVRVFWLEKRRLLKLSVPTCLPDASCMGQIAFGADQLPVTGDEAVAQKWVALVSQEKGLALTCVNDGTYGLDCRDGELRLSLLRSPGYAAHPIGNRPVMPQDRFSPHIDQGERLYRFWINGGPSAERMQKIDREALVHNERPFALSYYPAGTGNPLLPALILDSESVQMAAFKPAEDGDGWIVRLHEGAGRASQAVLRVPALGLSHSLSFKPYQVHTLRIRASQPGIEPAGLCEELGV